MSKPIALEFGKYYHIYSRGTNRESIFIEPRNYTHFLRLYAQYAHPVCDTYAYCLLRNHFHLLIRLKTPSEMSDQKPVNSAQAFSNLLNAYAKSINRAYQRTGSLFQHPFGRKEVTSDRYFAQLVVYIHQNPQKHGLIDDFRQWSYSSYPVLLSHANTRLRRAETLDWFGDVTQFCVAHDLPSKTREFPVLIEDDLD